jgi:hypothetical protein
VLDERAVVISETDRRRHALKVLPAHAVRKLFDALPDNLVDQLTAIISLDGDLHGKIQPN